MPELPQKHCSVSDKMACLGVRCFLPARQLVQISFPRHVSCARAAAVAAAQFAARLCVDAQPKYAQPKWRHVLQMWRQPSCGCTTPVGCRRQAGHAPETTHAHAGPRAPWHGANSVHTASRSWPEAWVGRGKQWGASRSSATTPSPGAAASGTQVRIKFGRGTCPRGKGLHSIRGEGETNWVRQGGPPPLGTNPFSSRGNSSARGAPPLGGRRPAPQVRRKRAGRPGTQGGARSGCTPPP